MRILFAGTPAPAVPTLSALVRDGHEVVGVITRPDAPVGRGRGLRSSEVAAAAEELGLPVVKPASLRAPEFHQWLREQDVEAVVVVAYGAMIPRVLLDAVPHGWLNLHFSLLPAWRGAAPVQHSIASGDDITGATVFRIDAGLDTGPVLAMYTEPVQPRDTTQSLMARLAEHGANLVCRTLAGLHTGQVTAVAQPTDGVSRAPMIHVDDARIDWSLPAIAIDRRIRAFTPAPGAWTEYRGVRVKIEEAHVLDSESADAGATEHVLPGTVRNESGRVIVATGAGHIVVDVVKPAGKASMKAADWLRGLRQADDTMVFEPLPTPASADSTPAGQPR